MDDIFDIQEKVAGSVVEGLKIHLASDEKKKLSERGTENAEAYELFLKANEYLVLYTKESMKHALNLYGEAIKLDPNYADAYSEKAYGLSMFFRSYDRDPKLLDEAESLAKQALNIKPDHWRSYGPLAHIYQFQGKLTQAEETAKEFVRKAPESDRSHFVLAYFYGQTGQPAKAIAPLEEAMRLVPDSLATLQNLVFACDEAGETEKCTYWAMVAIPLVEKYLRLHPDDEIRRVQHAILLFHAKRMADARTAVRALSDIKDGANLFNLGLLLVHFEEFMDAIATFRKSFETGFVIDVEGFRRDHDLDPLRSMPEFEELVKELEEKQNA
jgi:adenylate cyclase